MTTREVVKRVPGSQQSMDWVVPPDLNGTSTNGWWRLHLRIVFEDGFGEESDAAILVVHNLSVCRRRTLY